MRYRLPERFVDEEAIAQGKSIVVDVRDEETMGWKQVRALLSRTPVPGAEVAGLVDNIGVMKIETIYLKVEEEISDEETSMTLDYSCNPSNYE